MNRRFLKIKNFKNIGIDKYQYLNLNNTLDPYKMGELVIIIGENNVGKSNILEAIERINSNNLEKDIPDFIGFDKSLPEISLVCVENEYKNKDTGKREGNYNTLKIYIDDLGVTRTSIEFANSNENIINNANNDSKEKEDNKVIDGNETKEITNNDSEEVDIIKEKYGINIKPNIFYYKENIIKNYDLTTTLENISESKFFKALLKSIDFNIDTIKLAYEKGKKNFAYREDYEKEINFKLNDIVSKKFNELYFNLNKSVQKYEFYIRLGDNNIHIYLKKNNQAINLDNQSIGFKWFFNLFFDFLHSDLLKRGDIVLMDEPDAHLSLPARRDLRKFLKKFARDNGITFMVATHNPSFIDINHLDEIRIVKLQKEGN